MTPRGRVLERRNPGDVALARGRSGVFGINFTGEIGHGKATANRCGDSVGRPRARGSPEPGTTPLLLARHPHRVLGPAAVRVERPGRGRHHPDRRLGRGHRQECTRPRTDRLAQTPLATTRLVRHSRSTAEAWPTSPRPDDGQPFRVGYSSTTARSSPNPRSDSGVFSPQGDTSPRCGFRRFTTPFLTGRPTSVPAVAPSSTTSPI